MEDFSFCVNCNKILNSKNPAVLRCLECVKPPSSSYSYLDDILNSAYNHSIASLDKQHNEAPSYEQGNGYD